jgi:hypothetical protein
MTDGFFDNNVRSVLILIATVVLAVIAAYEFSTRVTTLQVRRLLIVNYSNTPAFPCGALTSVDSAAENGITNVEVLEILKTNDFANTMWLFSTESVDRVRYMGSSGMIFITPFRTSESGKLYLFSVRRVSCSSVKMASPE